MEVDNDKFLNFNTKLNDIEQGSVKSVRSTRTKMKYQPEDYRKTFKEQNANRRRIHLFSNRVVPYQGCVDYSLSKNVVNNLQTKLNFENIIQRNVLTSNSFAQIKLYHVEEDLEILKREELRRRQILDKKWRDLHQKEDNLKKSFIEFDKFIIQNQGKRERATEKIYKNQSLSLEKTRQIEELEKEYVQCKELKELLDNGIKNHSHIERYLLAVVDKNHKNFPTIEDLFKRFDALLEARHVLSNLFERYLTQMEDAKDAVDKMVMVKCVEIAGLRNTVADLHNRFETAQLACANWEQYHHKVVLEAMNKVMEIQSVKDSIWQIYEDICKRKGVQPVYKGNYAKQLEIIKKALLKFNLVNKMARALEVTSDKESSSDSIVVSVVKKVAKKLEENTKSLPQKNTKLKLQESKSNNNKLFRNLLAVVPSTQNIKLNKRRDEHSGTHLNALINSRKASDKCIRRRSSSRSTEVGNNETGDDKVENDNIEHRNRQYLRDIVDENIEQESESSFDLKTYVSECLGKRESLIDFKEENDEKLPDRLLLSLKEKRLQNSSSI